MKYYDYIKEFFKGNINTDICDKEIDICVNFSFDVDDVNKYQDQDDSAYFKVMDYLARNLEVDRVLNGVAGIVVLDIYDYCKSNFDKLVKVFDNNFYGFSKEDIKKYGKDEVVGDMVEMFVSIISGNVSLSFYEEFIKVMEVA